MRRRREYTETEEKEKEAKMIYVGEGGREGGRGPLPLPGLKGLKRGFDGRWRKAKPTGEGGEGRG